MSRRSTLRRLGLGQSEAPRNPANFPMASVAQLNQALATAKANGVDPSVIQSLWMAGADMIQLQLAASGPEQAAAALAPGGSLQSLTGVTPVAGDPVTSALLFPQASIPQYQGWGPLSPSDISELTQLVDTASSALATPGGGTWLAWLGANWPWLAVGAVGVWWVSKQV